MDITKLTIHGFKSFYEKSVFTFGKNITAIVGPNGSGKSNITEGVRFVLGEQGAKAMRGKDITDMLFRGGSVKANKAKVEIVFKKNIGFAVGASTENVFVKNALEKDEVVVSRTVFADGKSLYEMNGVEVRLKDVQEFLLFVNLGNKSNWHISQGEADRVLSANTLERKALIEDALGLKVYHARINESNRKLEKTRENIREASLQRKEIFPELSMLARTVDKINRSSEFRNELVEKAKIFFSYKKAQIFKLKNGRSGDEMSGLQSRLQLLEQEISQMQSAMNKLSGNDEEIFQAEIHKEQKILKLLQEKESELSQTLQTVENVFTYSSLEEERILVELREIEKELNDISASGNDVIFSEQDVNSTKGIIESNVNMLINSNGEEYKQRAMDIDLNFKKLLARGSVVTKDNLKQISYLQSIRTRLQDKLQNVRSEKETASAKITSIKPALEKELLKIKLVNEKISDIQKQILENKYVKVEREKDIQVKIFERSQLQIEISELQILITKIAESEEELKREIWEIENLLGSNLSSSLHVESDIAINEKSAEILIDSEDVHNLKRQIERIKLRLEESVVQNPDEVLAKHKQLAERDEFLLKEIADLEDSMVNLETLILDLKKSLTEEFDRGLEQINIVFDSYVKKLFGGGAAKVFVVEIENKAKKDDDGIDTLDKNGEVKTGVEVEVEIPRKKVKGLHSLSGGERALVSIALNFSIINQNPAPFMILDETDAALDEANSKRYGEMLEMLKEKTKLIVVTHNRETMHFADQIYGVTLHKDGHSKILSVSFDEASEWAK